MTLTSDTSTDTHMRSLGHQVRSRDRVELLLAESALMIAEGGVDALKMRVLARRSGLPIASVYHYFSSSTAVIRELALRHLQQMHHLLVQAVARPLPPDLTDLERAQAGSRLAGEVLDFLMKNAAFSAAIWDSLRANPDLRAVDMQDSARNAAQIEPFLAWVAPTLPVAQLPDMSMMVLEAIQSNVLLILHAPAQRVPHLSARLQDLVTALLRGLQLANPR